MVYPEMKTLREKITNGVSPLLLSALLILSLLALSCTTGQQNPTRFENAPLYGMIYDYQNMPVKGVIIREGEKVLGESDINGRFYLPQMEQGTHELIMEKEGYERLNLSFRFQNRTEALYIKMRSAFDCMTEANRMLARQSYARAEELIRLGLEIQSDHLGLQFLKSIYHFELTEFQPAFQQISRLMEIHQRREKELYLMLNQIRIAEPALSEDISRLIQDFPPPPQWNFDFHSSEDYESDSIQPEQQTEQQPERQEPNREGETSDQQ